MACVAKRLLFRVGLLVVSSLFPWWPPQPVAADQAPISIAVKPQEIPLGGIALVTILCERGVRVHHVRFRGREVPFRQESRSEDYYALIGAGLDCRPGPHVLVVEWQGQNGGDITSRRISVLKRHFPTEHLSVAPKMVEFPPEVLRRVLADQAAVRGTCETASDHVYWNGRFFWPVQSTVVSPFGRCREFNGKPRDPHTGVDLRAPEGTTVLASNAGRVALVRDCYLSGKTVVLDHGAGLYTLYAHLSSAGVRTGQMIGRREIIGLSGSSGRATGPHLHWGVSLLGERLDPVELLKVERNPAGRSP